MGILDNTSNATNNAGTRSTASNKRSDQPAAQVWANVGYTVKGAGPEAEDVFVSLPLGLAIDTMQPSNESVNSESFAMQRQAGNALLKKLQDAAADLVPGEAKTVMLEVELRRVKDKATSNINDNTLIHDINLFG